MNPSHKPWLIIWLSSNNATLTVMWSKAAFHNSDLNTLLDLFTMALLLCTYLIRKCIFIEIYIPYILIDFIPYYKVVDHFYNQIRMK